MAKKYAKPKRPRIRRVKHTRPFWVRLEPSRLGVLGGAAFAWIALVIYFLRQVFGAPLAIDDVAVGVLMTFVLGYAGTGLFVVYLLWVAERELPEIEEVRHAQKLGSGEKRAARAAEENALPEESPAADESVDLAETSDVNGAPRTGDTE